MMGPLSLFGFIQIGSISLCVLLLPTGKAILNEHVLYHDNFFSTTSAVSTLGPEFHRSKDHSDTFANKTDMDIATAEILLHVLRFASPCLWA